MLNVVNVIVWPVVEKKCISKTDKHMLFLHACPEIINIITILREFMADDSCYELATELTKKIHMICMHKKKLNP